MYGLEDRYDRYLVLRMCIVKKKYYDMLTNVVYVDYRTLDLFKNSFKM